MGRKASKTEWEGPEELRALCTPIADLRAAERNARAHPERSVAGIAESLREFGQRKPIVVSAAGEVIAGNGTLAAAKRLGWSKLAVVRVADDEERARLFALADNRTAELSAWDFEELTVQLADLELPAEWWSEGEIAALAAPVIDVAGPIGGSGRPLAAGGGTHGAVLCTLGELSVLLSAELVARVKTLCDAAEADTYSVTVERVLLAGVAACE